MRFLACLKKDIRLMTGGGIRTLLFLALPAVLVFLMLWGMRGLDAESFTKSFPIAVRDNDNTLMSGMLISRLDDIGMFDKVVHAENETDGELLEAGCAAVVTVPKDFFYDIYDMSDTDVVISLNMNMPHEAAIVMSTFGAITRLLTENQRASYAAARVKYGELGPVEWEAVYRDYSLAALDSALSRLDVFSMDELYTKGYDGTKLFFGASVISMIMLFMPLMMLRSVPEEIGSGLAGRFSLAGGSVYLTVLSKLAIAFIFVLVPTALILIVLKIKLTLLLAAALVCSFLFSFSLFLVISLLTKDAALSQFSGVSLMLFILLAGGAFYPGALLGKAFGAISGYLMPGMILSAMLLPGGAFKEMLPRFLALIVPFAVFAALSAPLIRSGIRRRA
ncbi:MAG: ABC transporter permease [Clostridiales bacterium]|nr:ABC transporter permease [Clostridiales bacterium]